jgi:hypothetical protein
VTRIVACLLAAAALLSGCGSSSRADPSPKTGAPTDLHIAYSRSGGIAGIVERVSIGSDGTARVQAGKPGKSRRFTLSRSERRGVRRAIDASGFAGLAPTYGQDQIADGFTTTVTYRHRTVTIFDDGQPPKRLTRLTTVLGAIVQRHGPR